MEIIVAREHRNPTCTIGNMYVDGNYFAYTLEDVVRPDGVKVPNETAIPAGRYKVVISYSNRFKRRMPEILEVPMFSGIRIHGGNTDANTQGCILIGKNTNFETQISDCAAVNEQLIELIEAANECWITIS